MGRGWGGAGETGGQSKESKSILMKIGDDLSDFYSCLNSGEGNFEIEDNDY